MIFCDLTAMRSFSYPCGPTDYVKERYVSAFIAIDLLPFLELLGRRKNHLPEPQTNTVLPPAKHILE